MNNTLPKYFTFISSFNENILKNNNINLGVIYRNYLKKIDINEIFAVKKYCKKKGHKFYISNNYKLAVKTRSDGLYIPSFNRTILHNKFNLIQNFKIIGSAHNHFEIKKKIEQGCEAIFVSPIFEIEKKRKVLGINGFNLLTQNYKVNFIALGGISKKNIKLLKMLRIAGFAGIRLHKKKPA